MTILTDHRAEAASGNAESLVVLLHGYGADGADLFGLAAPLSRHMPDTVFRAPDAPERNALNPMGCQWFPIPHLDGSTEEQRNAGFERSVGLLGAYLDEVTDIEGVAPEKIALVGFSQGTMMALHVAPRRSRSVACVVGFSGRLVGENLAAEARVKPPILLTHGDRDEMIPVSEMSIAETTLRAAGFDVRSHVSRGTGHGIAPDALTLALQFMTAHLGTAAR